MGGGGGGGGGMKSNPSKARKRVEATERSTATATATATAPSLVRAKDGSAFARCVECNKDVPVALISMHSCSLDAKIKMNLESQLVENENPPEANNKNNKPPTATHSKRSTTSSQPKSSSSKRPKKAKDPNAPKRPLTAFFLFLDDFRKSYKEANPDSKGVKMVAKEGGEKWKSMTDEEKKPYVDKAAELKAEYKKSLETDDAEEDADDGETEEVTEKEASEKEAEEISG